MLRFLASILLVAQMTALAGPAFASVPPEADVTGCAQTSSEHMQGASISAPVDCESCGIPDCHSTVGCLSLTVAAAANASVTFPWALTLVSKSEPAAVRDEAPPAPSLPPPKA